MKRWVWLILWVLVVVPAASAQETPEWWQDGCDPRARALIEPDAGAFDYAGACDLYRTCDPFDNGDRLCQMRAFEHLRAVCTAGDLRCEQTAMLYAAAIIVYDMPFGEAVGFSPPQSVIDDVPRALVAFQAGDLAGALQAYESTSQDNFTYQSMLPLSRAIVQTALGNSDAALAEFDAVFAIEFSDPLTHVARASLYGSLGRRDEASWDIAALVEYVRDTPELAAMLDEYAARYPLDTTIVQNYLRYPVMYDSAGPAGLFYVDDTLREPRPARVGYYEALDTLLVIGAADIARMGESLAGGEGRDLVQILRRNERGGFAIEYPSQYEGSGSLSVDWIGDVVVGYEGIGFFEGASRRMFLLAPASVPDPRLDIDGERPCPGGKITRLRAGMTAQSASYDGIRILPAPGGSDSEVIDTAFEVRVVGDPVCVESIIWWQVESIDKSGLRGWAAEAWDSEYRINPPFPWLFYCPSTPSTRLFVGAEGRVVVGLGANNLREQPNAASAEIGSLPEGAQFNVIGGPTCADGYAWWQIEYEGVTGWTAEGEGETYWLEVAS